MYPIQLKQIQHGFSGNNAGKKNKSGNTVGIWVPLNLSKKQIPTVLPLLFFLPALLH